MSADQILAALGLTWRDIEPFPAVRDALTRIEATEAATRAMISHQARLVGKNYQATRDDNK